MLSVLLLSACSKDVLDTSGTIAGIVTEASSNQPLQGVSVTINPLGRSYTTGADGRYEFKDIDYGSYVIQVSKTGYKSDQRNIDVRVAEISNLDFQLSPASPVLEIVQKTLDFGNDANSLALDIKNPGYGTLNWQLTENAAWLTCNPTTGSVQAGQQQSIVVTVDRSTLSRGNYSENITFTSNGGSSVVQVNISVQGISLTASPDELDFGSTTTSLTLTLTNKGTGNVSYQFVPSNDWIKSSPASGIVTYNATVTVSVDRAGKSEGDYSGVLQLRVGDESLDIPIRMNIPSKSKPVVNMTSAESTGGSTAYFKGAIVSIGSARVTRHGFCWSTSEQPDVNSTTICNLGDCASPKDFEYSAANLQPETRYYVRAFAENAEGISYSNQVSFQTTNNPEAPTVETGSVSGIGTNKAQVSGNILKIGNDAGITQYGHVWDTKANPTTAANRTTLGSTQQTGPFTSTLTDLQPNVTYHVRAYATNALGTSYGEDVTFSTTPDAVSLTTIAATDITHNEATLGGSISDTGGNEITERGVCYATTANPTLSGSHQAASATSNRYTVRINGLTPLTQYHARAYVSTKAGETYYGNDVTFSTTHEIVLGKVAATTVSGIATHAATFRSSITSDGDGTVSDCGFVFAKTGGATIDKGTRISCGAKQSGNFTTTVENLSDNTTYYVRAYIINQAGTAYGEETNFATLEVTIPAVSTTTVTKVTHRSATFTGSVSSVGNGTLTDAGFVYSTSPNPGLTNHKLSCGAKTQLSIRTSELIPQTTYYVRAYATNEKGTAFGEQQTFTTNEEPKGSDFDKGDFGDEKDWN